MHIPSSLHCLFLKHHQDAATSTMIPQARSSLDKGLRQGRRPQEQIRSTEVTGAHEADEKPIWEKWTPGKARGATVTPVRQAAASAAPTPLPPSSTPKQQQHDDIVAPLLAGSRSPRHGFSTFLITSQSHHSLGCSVLADCRAHHDDDDAIDGDLEPALVVDASRHWNHESHENAKAPP